jgi:hypothetical protein
MVSVEPLILAVVSEPDSWRGFHLGRVKDRLRGRARVVHFDAWRSPLAEQGLSLRQQGGKTIVSLGLEEICPDAIWWWAPISRVRDGLVSAAVRPLIGQSEVILADALRQVMQPGIVEVLGDLAHRTVLRHIDALETAFPPDRYVNPPAANRRAANKPYNLQVAADLGFLVPEDTLFTQDPAVARAWVREQYRRGRRVLWKFAVNAGFLKDDRLHTVPATELRREHEPEFPYAMVRHMPLIFEVVVPGDRDLRVVVVGHEVFAAQIIPVPELGTLDPRAGEHRYEPYAVSSALKRKCRTYAEKGLGLRYCVIDFRLTPDAQTVFLEAQGDGTFAEVEKTEQDVSGALARQLLAAAAPRS